MKEIKLSYRYSCFENLHHRMTVWERNRLTAATFTRKDIDSTEVLKSIFCGMLVTQEIDGDENAMGFIGGVPTHAVAEFNRVVINIHQPDDWSDREKKAWSDSVLGNFFGVAPNEIVRDTTIRDTYAGMLIYTYFICDDTIVMEFYHDEEN